MVDNFQQRSTKIGQSFEEMCNVTLAGMGWELRGREHICQIGVEIDQVADNQHGISFFFEYKGSTQGSRPGLIRTDSTKKAIANAFLLDTLDIGPFVILTSHLPTPGTDSDAMLKAAKAVIFDVVCLYNPKDVRRLERYLRLADKPTEIEKLEERR